MPEAAALLQAANDLIGPQFWRAASYCSQLPRTSEDLRARCFSSEGTRRAGDSIPRTARVSDTKSLKSSQTFGSGLSITPRVGEMHHAWCGADSALHPPRWDRGLPLIVYLGSVSQDKALRATGSTLVHLLVILRHKCK